MCMNTITLAVETCFSLKTWLLWAESLHGAGRNTTERFSMHERVDCLHLMDLQPAEGNSPVGGGGGGTGGVGPGEEKTVGDGMGLRIFPNVLGVQYMKGGPSLNLVSVRHCLVFTFKWQPHSWKCPGMSNSLFRTSFGSYLRL